MIFPYVAVVCDTDGSAFITKAEFDSLKNNFQAQIDNYNQSIDSKIDGAIASYLAGIKVNTDDTPEFKVWGTKKIGTYLGKTCNRFNMIEVDNGHCSTGWGDAYMSIYPQIDINDYYHIGPGIWITGLNNYNGGDTYYGLKENDGLYAVAGYLTTTDARFNYKIGDGSAGPTGYGGSRSQVNWGSYTTASSNWNKLYTQKLSVVYNTPVGFINPTFKLYEFLDSGTVSVGFAFAKNGYNTDGAEHLPCGTNGTSAAFNVSGKAATTRGVFVQHLRGGSVVASYDLSRSGTELVWNDMTYDVNAGDTIGIKCICTDTGASSGKYFIMWFTDTIPGWKVQVT